MAKILVIYDPNDEIEPGAEPIEVLMHKASFELPTVPLSVKELTHLAHDLGELLSQYRHG